MQNQLYNTFIKFHVITDLYFKYDFCMPSNTLIEIVILESIVKIYQQYSCILFHQYIYIVKPSSDLKTLTH